MRTNVLLTAAVIACLVATPVLAGTRITQQEKAAEAVRADAEYHRLFDHPRVQPVASGDVKMEVTGDKFVRSCCKPPDYLIMGNLWNISSKPIDYVMLKLVFKDKNGNVVYTEDGYNHQAVTLGEDPEIAQVLKESPHFDPLPAGAKDTFYFYIPLPFVPRYASVELQAAQIVRNAASMQQQAQAPTPAQPQVQTSNPTQEQAQAQAQAPAP